MVLQVLRHKEKVWAASLLHFVECIASQTWHCQHYGLDNFFLGGADLSTVDYLTVSWPLPMWN
jgi:hypothetical protein